MKNIQKVARYSVVLTVLIASFVIPAVSKAQYSYPLQVTCRPNTYSAQTNTSVGWSASGTGGNGIYTYLWSGTDGISGNVNSILQTYTTEGTKTASITVTSAGQSVTVNCGNIYVYSNSSYYYGYPYNYNYSAPISGSCSANVNNAYVGNTINWAGTASGGNGVYTYYWNDSDGYSSTGQYLSRYYSIPGWKYMNLTITSNGQSITKACSVYITSGATIINSNYQNQNQVLAYTDTNPNVSSVYLSDVPYTGFDDFARPLLFIIALMLWSGILAYMFLKKKIGVEILVPEKILKNTEIAKVKISKDEKDIKQIEDYARMKKVLLSSDATIKIFKLSKLGEIDAAETIRKMADADWTAIGENDLEKYI